MWIIKLAWKNIWRNKTRTTISVSAIFFAVILSATAESLKQGIFDNLVRNIVGVYSGYIQIHKKGYHEEQTLDNGFRRLQELERKVQSTVNVEKIAPRIESFALISSETFTKGCLVSGIDPASENDLTSLKSRIIQGEYLHEGDDGVLLSLGLSERLNIETSDTVCLIAQGYHGSTAAGKFPIRGILKFGSPQLNDRMLYMSLANAGRFFESNGVLTSYILSLQNPKLLQSTLSSLRIISGDTCEVMSWEELMPEIKQHIDTDSNNMKAVQIILYLLISFGIFGTMLMMMMERRFEMGLLLAIGMKKNLLMKLFITESLLTVFTGCVLGLLTAVPVVFFLNRYPIRITGETARAYERFGFEAIFPASTHVSIFIFQTLVVLLIGLALSVYPLIKVVTLKLPEALKK